MNKPGTGEVIEVLMELLIKQTMEEGEIIVCSARHAFTVAITSFSRNGRAEEGLDKACLCPDTGEGALPTHVLIPVI
jgi:hypothetical protein